MVHNYGWIYNFEYIQKQLLGAINPKHLVSKNVKCSNDTNEIAAQSTRVNRSSQSWPRLSSSDWSTDLALILKSGCMQKLKIF